MIPKTNNTETTKLMCGKCGYSWTTKSDMIFVTCPNCQSKVNKNTAQNEIEGAEGVENGKYN